MELRQLRYFLAVAEELNFTRAAAQLYVSQSTLSEQISALEREVGGRLLQRNSRHVELTVAGDELLPHARRAVSAAVEGLARAREALTGNRDGHRPLRLGMTPEPHPPIVAAMIRSFTSSFPNVPLLLTHVGMSRYDADLVEGRLDALLAWLPLPPETLTWDVLTTEEQLVGFRWDHPFADAETLTAELVLDEPMPRPDPTISGPIADHWLLRGQRGGYLPRLVGAPASTPEEVGRTVLRERAVATCFASYARQTPANGLLQFRRMTDPPMCHFVLARRAHDNSAGVQALRHVARTSTPVL